jgi:hypothetical protein
MPANKKTDEAADRRLDSVVEDSFPASDPPANSGIVGPRGKSAHDVARRPPQARDDGAGPKGRPTDERHTTETGHVGEDAVVPRRR